MRQSQNDCPTLAAIKQTYIVRWHFTPYRPVTITDERLLQHYTQQTNIYLDIYHKIPLFLHKMRFCSTRARLYGYDALWKI